MQDPHEHLRPLQAPPDRPGQDSQDTRQESLKESRAARPCSWAAPLRHESGRASGSPRTKAAHDHSTRPPGKAPEIGSWAHIAAQRNSSWVHNRPTPPHSRAEPPGRKDRGQNLQQPADDRSNLTKPRPQRQNTPDPQQGQAWGLPFSYCRNNPTRSGQQHRTESAIPQPFREC